ncbi:beta-N-acetylhexosaminidase [Sneathiella marina]|uniref:beta-N-acetylhexosaminidase n=1 Tax=Sneathiella marina TaxID=2950108 RepID=A0ABY4VYS5_9PROT|nr:beta-N-acetylhexosaminidase [Sneathiella marina]USG59889.1 beta-N-acetylhexosaminidase [Sneathiella marina]
MSADKLRNCKSLILGCAGLQLSDMEIDFFAEQQPYGFILFARNVDTPEQVKHLTQQLRSSVGRPDAPVLMDQEGGRVQRMRSPHWFDARPFGFFGALYKSDPELAREALALTTRLIAADLLSVGVNVDCTPCLDLLLPETAAAIGDRAFTDNPAVVAELGALVAEEMIQAGILPVIKHMPGHGRGTVDSHHELPLVTLSREALGETDFIPFKALAHLPWGMTSHIVFDQIDPEFPATQSAKVIEEIIRGDIGFEGLLLTDDLNMNALSGTLADRAARALQAGVDIVLHCSGKMPEMQEVAPACSNLSEKSLSRIAATNLVFDHVQDSLDPVADLARLDSLLAES